MANITISTTFCTIACPRCAALFAIPDDTDDQLRKDGRSFYCPNGHTMSYHETTEKQLREAKDALARERAKADQLRADRDAADRRASAAKGQVTKIKKRVGRGVCPCCNRTFADLGAHMATKHPDYAPKDESRPQGLTG